MLRVYDGGCGGEALGDSNPKDIYVLSVEYATQQRYSRARLVV